MADDKTEQPTPKRLQEARKKGQVFKSADLTQALLFLTAAAVLSFSGAGLVNELKAFMVDSLDSHLLANPVSTNVLLTRFANASTKFLLLSLPLLFALAVAGVGSNFAQLRGLIFAPEGLSPKFNKLNPVAGMQNILFKGKTYIELIKNLLKFSVILCIAYVTLMPSLRDMVVSSRLGLDQTAAFVPTLLFGLLFRVGGVFLILGAADFAIQKKMFTKGLMMSKDEVKREFKEQEGDPEVKGHRKHLHMQMLRENAVKRVPQAAVVVVNPTHLAVALQYDEARMNAPQVIAKGEMFLAGKIRRIAESAGVPIVQNVPLAHSLYALELEEEIPEDLYTVVAEVLNLAAELAQKHGN